MAGKILMTTRRRFSALALTALAGVPLSGTAQERPVEGKHYMRLPTRQPTRDPKRVEVLEFFAYSCSHCHDFEPAVDAWQKKLPPDVLFRRIPVAFRENMVLHQKLYFAIEALGLVERLHGKVFTAIHSDHQRLDTPDDIGAFVARHGVDRTRFIETLNSFTVAGMAKQASQLTAGYNIIGTPSLGVDGRWLTSGSLAGSNEDSLTVAEYLVGLAKKVR